MTSKEWAVFGGFSGMLIGLSLINARLAMLAGGTVIVVILLQHPGFFGTGQGSLFGFGTGQAAAASGLNRAPTIAPGLPGQPTSGLPPSLRNTA